jgi:hypothetical protein
MHAGNAQHVPDDTPVQLVVFNEKDGDVRGIRCHGTLAQLA